MSRTMILFLSQYNNQESAEYTADRGFVVTGAQTNEAPTKYAIQRLMHNDATLDRILAFVTPKAKETAFEHYKSSIESYCTEINIVCPEIIPIEDIPNDVTISDLLQKTILNLFPIESGDSVIIETTGGYRHAVNALTLFSRMLRYIGVQIEFSTYSDLQEKKVTDTKETDDLFAMLDAVNLFATTGNPRALQDSIRDVTGIPEKSEFTKTLGAFYNSILCCKFEQLDDVIKNLSLAIDSFIKMEYDATDTKRLILRDLVIQIVLNKMKFVYEKDYFIKLIRWCCDNDYLQQAVTILWEKKIRENYWKRIPYKMFVYLSQA